jgi:flagellar motility protein MotE (MotC chaperone)
MLKPKLLLSGILTAAMIAGFPSVSLPQEPRKPEVEAKKPAIETNKPDVETKKPDVEVKKADPDGGDGVQQYCSSVANFAADARIAWQMKRLDELETRVKQRVTELEAKEAESKDWVVKREELMKKAEDSVVAIYSKMEPEAAAAQMAVLDEPVAAAVLSKLKPGVSSAILNEMEPGKAAKLTNVMSGLASQAADRKKS